MPTRKATIEYIGDASSLIRATKRAEAATNNCHKSLGSRLKGATVFAAASAGAAGLAGSVVGIVKAGAEFEKQMSALKSVSGAGAREMAEFKKQAIDAGIKTKFSAKQAAEAQTELAKGGLSVANIMGGGLKSALALAAAGNMDLGEAAATTANAMNLFGLHGKASAKVADQFATAANATTADVSDFAMALSQGGSVAKSVGLSFTDTTLALEALAASGIKNSDAGTSLKTALIHLVNPTKTAAGLMETLGLKFTDNHGRMKSLESISGMLRDKLGDMSKAQRTATLAQIAGTDGVRTLTALYDTGPAKLDKFRQGLEQNGTAARTAATMQDNLAGKFENLKGTMETVAIVLFDKVKPALTTVVSAVGAFAQGVLTGKGAGGAFASVVAEAFGRLVDAGKRVVSAVSDLVSGFKAGKTWAVAVGGALAAFTAGLGAYRVAVAVATGATKAWAIAVGLVDKAMKLSTVGLVIAGLVALGVALVIAYKKSQTFRTVVDGAFRGVKAAGKWLVQAGKDIADWVSGAVSSVHRFASGVAKWIDNAAGNIKRFPGRVVGFFKALPGEMLGIGKDVISGLANGIRAKLDDLKNFVVRLATGVIGWFKDAIGAHSPSREFHKIGEYIAEGLRDGIKAGKPWVDAAVKTGLLFPLDAAIAALNAKKEKLQASFDAWDVRRGRGDTRMGLIDALSGGSSGDSSGGSRASGGGSVKSLGGSGAGNAHGVSAGQRATIVAAALKYGIDPAVLFGVYGAESVFGKNLGPSSAGAVGPFQFMPGTARGLGVNPNDFKSAAFGAAKYLKQLLDRFHSISAAIGHYNSGPAGNLTNSETAAYIPKVLGFARDFQFPRGSRAGSGGSAASSAGSARGGDALAWAKSMIGHFKESTGKNTGPELDQLQKAFGTHAAAWCAEFATTALIKAGAPAELKTARVKDIRAWANAGTHGLEKGIKSKPKAGDLMMFGDQHIGVVESVRGGKVHTIEGNTSAGKVARRTHNVGDGDFARVAGGLRGGSASGVADAIKGMRDFERERKRTAALAKIDLQIAGIERLKAVKGALSDIASTIKDKVQTAAENFRGNWENTVGASIRKTNEKVLKSFDDTTAGILQNFDDVRTAALQTFDDVKNAQLEAFDVDTEAIIANSPANKALADARATANAEDMAAEDKANQKALDDAVKTGDQEAIAAAKETIRKTARERNITRLEGEAADERVSIQKSRADQRTTIERANAAERTDIERTNAADRKAIEEGRAAERGALEDQMLADYTARVNAETAVFAASLQARLDAEVDQLKQRKNNYAGFVKNVNDMLQPLGLGFEPTAEQEALLNGTNPAAPPPTAGPGTGVISAKSLSLFTHPLGRRAKGGPVSAGTPYIVGENGMEVFTPNQSGRIIPNGAQLGASGGFGELMLTKHGNVTIRSTREALTMANKIAFRMAT